MIISDLILQGDSMLMTWDVILYKLRSNESSVYTYIYTIM